MIGTVTGFLLMLGTAFENIDVSNTETLQKCSNADAFGYVYCSLYYTYRINLLIDFENSVGELRNFI